MTWALAQDLEFEYHAADLWRRSDNFELETSALLQGFGLNREGYAGRTIIDLGAGSRMRTKYFTGARLIAIEPLANRYMREIAWCDLGDCEEVYTQPAETYLPECAGRADLLLSINVLDHCFDFAAIVRNIAAYLKPDGLAVLSFDIHETADPMHPLTLTQEQCVQAFEAHGLRIGQVHTGPPYGRADYRMDYHLWRA
jgi:SAM-dependent methyltransferase